MDIAVEANVVVKPSLGWYSKVDTDTGEVEDKKYRIKDTDTKDFWLPILTKKSFSDFVKNKYQVATTDILNMKDDEIDAELAKIDSEA